MRRHIGMRMVAAALMITTVLVVGCEPQADPSSEALPSSFDLRDVAGESLVTPVGMQLTQRPDGTPDVGDGVGCCWAFGSDASFESSLLMQGIVASPLAPQADLSEWHLAYWNGYNDPVLDFHDTPIPGTDPVEPSSYMIVEPEVKGWGGPSYYAIDYFASGKGPVLERDAPFPAAEMSARERLTPPPVQLDVAYRLQDAHVFRYEDFDGAEEYRDAVKRAVTEHGVIQSFVYFDAAGYPGQKGPSLYDSESATLFCDDPDMKGNLNHAVAIAGWDDERSIEGTVQPGAWLIKNSLGTNFGEDGYMWVAYADEVFLKEDTFAVAFVGATTEGYANAGWYQTHDGALSNVGEDGAKQFAYLSDGMATAGRDSWACARFVASEVTEMRAVGLMTMNPGEEIELSIHRGWNESLEQPRELVDTQRFSVEQAGYHVLDLDEHLPLAAGEEFVVAVGFAAREDSAEEPLCYVLDTDSSSTVRTYRGAVGSEGNVLGWGPYESSGEPRVFYVQAIMSE